MDRYVYLDNNGTTRTADEVLEFMKDNSELYGNASSMHTLGRNAAAGIDWARGRVASLIGAEPEEIYFTSGATESNNTVFGIFRDRADDGDKRSRIVISSVLWAYGCWSSLREEGCSSSSLYPWWASGERIEGRFL